MFKGKFSARIERFTATVLSHRWLVIVLMAAGAHLVIITNDYRTMFGEDNPEFIAFNSLQDTYSSSNRALIVIAPQGGSVFTREALGAVVELTEAAWRTPHSSRVDSLTNYSHSEAFEDDLVVAPLVEDAHSLSDADLARVKTIALNATDIAGRLVSHDGHVAGLSITFVIPEDHDPAVIRITDYLDSLLDEARAKYPDIDYYMTGDVVMNRTFAEAAKDDLQTLTPLMLLMLLIIVIVSALLLRSALGTAAIIAVVLFAVNTTMGFAGWSGAVYGPANSGVPIIVMVISVTYSIHIVTNVLLGMRHGLDKNAAIAESMRINAYPVFLTALTTAIGFLSLNASDSPPFHVLGNHVAFGVACAFVYCMTLLPALLSVLPLHVSSVQAERHAFFDRFVDFIVARSTPILGITVLLAIVLVSGIPRNELTDNWTLYFDDRYEFRRDTDYVIENLTGMDVLNYSLDTGRDGGITDPEYLRKIDAFAEWYREQPEVLHVQAFSDIMKRLNKNMHGDDPGFYRLPDSADLAAQYLLLYELSLPFGSDLNDRIDVAKSATRLSAVTRSVSTRNLRELDTRAQAWLRTNAPDLATAASGISVIFANVAENNIHSMLRGTIIAMALISLILLWVFKSVRLGLISLLPNFIPAAMSFGLWGYLVGRVGLSSSVVVIIAFGIIVDDTIHFLTKYQESRRDGLLAPEAIRSTFHTVGHALWTTTVVLAAGFLIFLASGFQLSWALGLLVAITIIFALAADFLFLPTLLIAIDRKRL